MKRGRAIICCIVGDCRHRLFVITSFHCFFAFFAGLHFETVHFTMAIQSSVNGFYRCQTFYQTDDVIVIKYSGVFGLLQWSGFTAHISDQLNSYFTLGITVAKTLSCQGTLTSPSSSADTVSDLRELQMEKLFFCAPPGLFVHIDIKVSLTVVFW